MITARFQAGNAQKQVLGRDELIGLEVSCLQFFEGILQRLVGHRGGRHLGGAISQLRQPLDFAHRRLLDGRDLHAEFAEQRNHDPFAIFQQRGQQMHRHHLGIAVLGGEIVGALAGFLRLNR